MQLSEVINKFQNEFRFLLDRFKVLTLTVEDAKVSDDEYVWHPGVYVWFHPTEGVLRVGRHLTNSRKRALEHIAANTGGLIAEFAKDEDTKIVLFNIKNPDDCHWVAALEIYLENQLNPKIKARLG